MAQIERPLIGGRPSGAGTPGAENRPGRGDLAAAAVAATATVASICALFLFPYLIHHFRYPLGWDASATVREAESIGFDGLARIGAIRAGTPLLLGSLMVATRQNAFTLVATSPAMFAGVAGLGAAAMVRAAFGIRARWVPVIGVLTWAAFGGNGMMNLHLDNVVNSALTLAGFAAAIAYVAEGRGVIASSILFAGAGLAHWPFWLFAIAVYLLAVAAAQWSAVRTDGLRAAASPLLVPAVASGAFVGLTFLAVPPSGFLGARLGALNTSLRERLLQRLHETRFYFALPFAAAGAYAAARWPVPASPARVAARRLFLAMMWAWILLTAVGVVAQWAGIPTAGGRLLLYLFPVTILAGVLALRLAEVLAGRAATVLGLAVVTVVVGGFGALTVAWRASQHPWIDPRTATQITASAGYLRQVGGDRPVVYVIGKSLSGKPSIQVVRAVLPPELSVRAVQYFGTPSGYLSGAPPALGKVRPPSPRSAAIVISLQGLGPKGYQSAAASNPGSVVAPGVAVVQGPAMTGPLSPVRPPMASTGRTGLVGVPLLILVVLFAVGGGWSLALLPSDPVVRICLAPALGMAVISLVALTWDRAGLSLSGNRPLVPLTLAAVAGWMAALFLRFRRPSTAG